MYPEHAKQKTIDIGSGGTVHKPDITIKLLSLGKQRRDIHFVAGVYREVSPRRPSCVNLEGPQSYQSQKRDEGREIPSRRWLRGLV